MSPGASAPDAPWPDRSAGGDQEVLAQRLGVEDDGPAGLCHLFAGPLADVAQRLDAVEDEEREADISKPGRVGRRAVEQRERDDRVGVALARDDERERALVARRSGSWPQRAARRRWPWPRRPATGRECTASSGEQMSQSRITGCSTVLGLRVGRARRQRRRNKAHWPRVAVSGLTPS